MLYLVYLHVASKCQHHNSPNMMSMYLRMYFDTLNSLQTFRISNIYLRTKKVIKTNKYKCIAKRLFLLSSSCDWQNNEKCKTTKVTSYKNGKMCSHMNVNIFVFHFFSRFFVFWFLTICRWCFTQPYTATMARHLY